MTAAFELICEIEPPTKPDLKHVRHQIGVLSKVADGFLIPDNHIGRATVSSIAVAHEVELMGGRSIACLNSRDRNLLQACTIRQRHTAHPEPADLRQADAPQRKVAICTSTDRD